MEKNVTIFDGSREGTREVKTKIDTKRVVEFLMWEKGPLTKHCRPSTLDGFWKGYAEALRNIIDEYDLVDTIAGYDDFEEWLEEDEQERRGL